MKMAMMSRRAALLTGLAVGLALPALAQQTQSAAHPAARAKIEQVAEQYRQAFNNKDAAGLAGLFAENGVLMIASPTTPVSDGRAAIQKLFEGAFERGARDLNSTLEDVQIAGDVAWARGTYDQISVPVQGATPQRVNGVWGAIYRQHGDGYKIEQLAAVMTPPAPAAPLVGSSTPPAPTAPASK